MDARDSPHHNNGNRKNSAPPSKTFSIPIGGPSIKELFETLQQRLQEDDERRDARRQNGNVYANEMYMPLMMPAHQRQGNDSDSDSVPRINNGGSDSILFESQIKPFGYAYPPGFARGSCAGKSVTKVEAGADSSPAAVGGELKPSAADAASGLAKSSPEDVSNGPNRPLLFDQPTFLPNLPSIKETASRFLSSSDRKPSTLSTSSEEAEAATDTDGLSKKKSPSSCSKRTSLEAELNGYDPFSGISCSGSFMFRRKWTKEEVDQLVAFTDKWFPTDGKRKRLM